MVRFTDYHAKYFAHELTKRCASDNVEKLAGALVDAQVDLNPHQVETFRPTVSILEPLVGQSGALLLSLLAVQALDQMEDYLSVAARTDGGHALDEEQAHRLLRLPARGRSLGCTNTDLHARACSTGAHYEPHA